MDNERHAVEDHDELDRELQIGATLATSLVDHLRSMGATEATIPAKYDGMEYEIIVRPKALAAEFTVDRKFIIRAENPINGKRYDESNSLLLCAKDAAVPAALIAYRNRCVGLGANKEHIDSINLLIDRVVTFQTLQGGGRTPNTVGEEIPRCLEGKGL
jgi:hypothetical protein